MFPKDLEGYWGSTIVSSLFSVKGKTVVITGGARGIGLMFALGFVENGANVILISRKPDPEATKLLESHVNTDCY
jgi:NAD(P)-dependent dehydrogenase (short-subunit alcohol dehydrogenase family)